MAKTFWFWATRALIAAIGFGGLWWTYYSSIAAIPPLTWSGSAVYPSIVRAGDEISVFRNFTVHREVVVEVHRRLISGDCSSKVGCTQYDLPTSTVMFEPTNYNAVRRHLIPHNVAPGKYLLQFEVHWQNVIGYRYAVRHPPLYIEVVR